MKSENTKTRVVLDITMSLDGYIAGPNISTANPLGEGGQRLHRWIFEDKTDAAAALLEETVNTSGAVITGGRTYHTAIEDAWGGVSPFAVPTFVVTHNVPARRVEGFTYVTAGPDAALTLARNAAGDQNIWVMGGGDMGRQYLRAGALDELHIHIAHVVLGGGTRLFDDVLTTTIELEKIATVETPGVSHFKFCVRR
ncbi:dihydrofolate reductase family protein [Chryseolinea lacunae]|uniref:Dihydrofolate reductase n=1 Tax=Chryseolinea lacunae TaxID=2801331 RepID=A0ABS1KZA7_9BACT|nr:dihydrofolate reductase family protein [Chryseolinea lacunae]MBL0744602.1 dihydrofolate reductase [Chryseolinea lacunae]